MTSTNKQLIAKNTLYLYARMILVMCVTLYTSRVILHTLGASDYGVYNVVGGIVVFFSFLSGSLSGATSRFLTYDLGREDNNQLKRTFSASLNIYISIAFLVSIVGELLGLWLVSTKLTIPEGRLHAAYWVLHFSIITTFFKFLQYPYLASLLAHEDMSVYAFVGIYEAVTKLLISYAITISPIDSLIFYALLLMLNQVFILGFYRFYAKRKYSECRFRLFWDKPLYIRLLSYSGYDMIPSMGYVGMNQGVDILLNMFFGPIANAANAIAGQVSGALNLVVSNMMQAARPQVIKNFAQGDSTSMYGLTFQVSKYSFFLMLGMTIPIFLELDFIISIWLGDDAPIQTVSFCRIVLLSGLIQTIITALAMPMHAIGKIRNFSIMNGCLYLIPLIVGFVLFKFGFPDYSIFVVIFLTNVLLFICNLLLLRHTVYFSLTDFFRHTILISIIITVISLPLPIFVHTVLAPGFLRLTLVILITELVIACSVWFLALNKELRILIKHKVLAKISYKIS